MKPTVITEPSVIWPAHVCAWLSRALALGIAELRRDHVILPADAIETADKVGLLGDAWTRSRVVANAALIVDSLDPASCVEFQSMKVNEGAF